MKRCFALKIPNKILIYEVFLFFICPHILCFLFLFFSLFEFGNATESFPNYYLASLFLFDVWIVRRCQLETVVIPFRVTLLKIGFTWLPWLPTGISTIDSFLLWTLFESFSSHGLLRMIVTVGESMEGTYQNST